MVEQNLHQGEEAVETAVFRAFEVAQERSWRPCAGAEERGAGAELGPRLLLHRGARRGAASKASFQVLEYVASLNRRPIGVGKVVET